MSGPSFSWQITHLRSITLTHYSYAASLRPCTQTTILGSHPRSNLSDKPTYCSVFVCHVSTLYRLQHAVLLGNADESQNQNTASFWFYSIPQQSPLHDQWVVSCSNTLETSSSTIHTMQTLISGLWCLSHLWAPPLSHKCMAVYVCTCVKEVHGEKLNSSHIPRLPWDMMAWNKVVQWVVTCV